MPKKFLAKAPFGVQTQRFNKIGFHPGLDREGTMVKCAYRPSPDEYSPEKFECAYKKYLIGGSRWKRKAILEEFSANLGFRNPEILEQRRYFKSIGGPGTYDIPEEVYKRRSFSAFGKSKRFAQFEDDDVPAPGTYTGDLVASSSVNKKQMTSVPSFEWDGFVDRFKRLNQPWKKAPNRYSPVDRRSVEALLAKVVSKKGPYNLFTGPRDGTTIKNHFAPAEQCAPDKYYTWPSHIDHLLHHPSKSKTGSFSLAPRFTKKPTVRILLDDVATCYRDPDSPSPATYHVQINSIKKLPQTLHPFDDSVTIARKGVKWEIKPGPGRYDGRPLPKCKDRKRLSSVFKSKTERAVYKVTGYGVFD